MRSTVWLDLTSLTPRKKPDTKIRRKGLDQWFLGTGLGHEGLGHDRRVRQSGRMSCVLMEVHLLCLIG